MMQAWVVGVWASGLLNADWHAHTMVDFCQVFR